MYALFSIANLYDQPDHNLVRLWQNKPTLEELAAALETTFPCVEDEDTIRLVHLWQKQEMKHPHDNTIYWLAEIQFGKHLPVRA